MDIGAPKSVVGKREARRILQLLGRRKWNLFPCFNRLIFEDAICDSLGAMSIPLAVPSNEVPIQETMDVVDADIPPLLGMDILDAESVTPCTVSNIPIK